MKPRIKLFMAILLLPCCLHAQTQFLATNGTIIRNSTPLTFTNNVTTDQAIFSSTVKGNTMTVDRPYVFTSDMSVTTPLISLPTISFDVKLGSKTLTFVSAASLLTSLSAVAITVSGYMVLRSDGTILVKFATQPTGSSLSPITLTTSNVTQYAVWSGVDITSDQVFSVNVAFSNIIGTTTITRNYYARSEF